MAAGTPAQFWDKSERQLYVRRHAKWLGDLDIGAALYPQRLPLTSLAVYSPPADEDELSRSRKLDSHPTFAQVAALGEGAWRPAEVGESFGPLWATHWFRAELTVPPEWAGEEVHFRWNSGTEALLLSESGVALQGLTAGFRAGPREEFVIGRSVAGGEKLVLFVEMACNDLLPAHDLLLGGPQVPGGPPAAQSYELTLAEIGVYDRALGDLLDNGQLLYEMADELPEVTQTAADAHAELNSIINTFRLGDRGSLDRALALSQRALARSGEPDRHIVSAVGHCHIDTAWLWTYRETRRKIRRSWASQLAYLEEYPDYRFVISQASQLAWLEEDDPELFVRVCAAVEAGQFIVTGGTWVEMDANVSSSESFSRQFLLGKSQHHSRSALPPFCSGCCASVHRAALLPEQVWGAIGYLLVARHLWILLADPAALPAGRHEVLHDPEALQLRGQPHPAQHLRLGRHRRLGCDRALPPGRHVQLRVLRLGDTALGAEPGRPPSQPAQPHALRHRVSLQALVFVQQSSVTIAGIYPSKDCQVVVRNRDGGGGPTRSMLERIRRVGDLRGLPKVQYQSPQHFFWQLEKDAEASAVQKDGGFVDDAAPAYVTGAQSAVSGAATVTASDPLFAPRPAAMPPPIGGGLPKWVGELYCEKR